MRAAVAFALLCAACSTTPSAPSAPSTAATTTEASASTSAAVGGLWHSDRDARIWGWVSSPWTFSTTSWAIEGDDGLVLIDTQFLPKDAVAFVEAVEGATGKKAKLAVVLHANPDKFNGTTALQARGIEVVTSSQVLALLPGVHQKRLAAFGARYAPDYPTAEPAPASFGDAVVSRDVAGVHLTLTPVGAGCSDAHVIAEFDDDNGRHVFVGDLVANGAHSWLELGRTPDWLARLDEIAARSPGFVYPGRGLVGDATLLSTEREYLKSLIADVSAADAAGGSDEEVIAEARRRILLRHPSLRFSVFLNIGLPAELARQRADRLKTP